MDDFYFFKLFSKNRRVAPFRSSLKTEYRILGARLYYVSAKFETILCRYRWRTNFRSRKSRIFPKLNLPGKKGRAWEYFPRGETIVRRNSAVRVSSLKCTRSTGVR